jgi:5'(3')-deoxyribonucleotidase
MRRIALDFDSTLAYTAGQAFELLCGPDHGYGKESIKDWTWGFREFGKEAYLSALWHAWTIRPEGIRPMEPGLDNTIRELRENFTVDIVTAHPDHPGITEGKIDWLERQRIGYDNFEVVDTNFSKANLNYDIYIDDKPALPKQVEQHNPNADVYLIDWMYNRDVEGEYLRVGCVAKAAEILRLEAKELANV